MQFFPILPYKTLFYVYNSRNWCTELSVLSVHTLMHVIYGTQIVLHVPCVCVTMPRTFEVL